MYRFRVGAVECAVLNDGDLFLPPEALFPPSRRSEWPPIQVDAQGHIAIAINCLLVWSDGKTVLVDTGNGTHVEKKFEGGGQLIGQFARVGVTAEEIDIVVLTHTHADHAGGMTVFHDGRFVPAFPRARYVIPKADWDYYTAMDRPRELFVERSLLPVAEHGQLQLVEGQDFTVASGVQLLPAPGHSPGNSVVLVESEGETALHTGDLFHHRVFFEHQDMVRDQEVLPEMVPVSRRKMIDLVLERSALLIAAHEPHPGLGRLVRDGDRVSFHPGR